MVEFNLSVWITECTLLFQITSENVKLLISSVDFSFQMCKKNEMNKKNIEYIFNGKMVLL